jgi:hypothetical protein
MLEGGVASLHLTSLQGRVLYFFRVSAEHAVVALSGRHLIHQSAHGYLAWLGIPILGSYVGCRLPGPHKRANV